MAAKAETPKQSSSSHGSVWKRIATSPVVLIAVFLLSIDGIVTGLIPWIAPDWYLSRFPNPEKHCAKALHYLIDKDNPSVVVLGSSLMRTAAEASDLTGQEELQQEQIGNDYDKAVFLKQQLEADLGSDVDLLNLAMRGSMASDYALLFQKIIEVGKQPKLVISTTAPAEFMSNDQPVVNNTYVHQAILNYKFPQGRPFFEVALDNIERAVKPHNLDAMERFLTYCRDNLVAYLSDASGHPKDLYRLAAYGAGKPKAGQESCQPLNCGADVVAVNGKNKLADLSHYAQRYHPPNTKLFAEHSRNYAEMLKRSHDSGIPLIVINMPITTPNRQLIDRDLLRRYYDFMEKTTRQYNITYINMDNTNMFQLTDFRDSSHLNSAGSKKFFTALAQELVKQSSFSSIAERKRNNQL